MYYLKVVCEVRDKVEVAKHYDLRSGAPGMPREKRRRKTQEEMAAQNRWRRRTRLRRLIEANFGPGDWHVVLGCRKGEELSAEDARKRIRKFRDRLQGAYKKMGWELKYVITCERGKRGRIHWHMIINDMHSEKESTAGMVRRLWEWGREYFSPLDSTGDYKGLAEYIIKECEREGEEPVEKQGYMSSRNLVRPVEVTEKVRAKGWRKEPKVPRGWELVPGTLVNGTNKYSGLPYQRYTIRRKEASAHEEGGHIHRHDPAGVRKRRGERDVHHADPAGRGRRPRAEGGGGD